MTEPSRGESKPLLICGGVHGQSIEGSRKCCVKSLFSWGILADEDEWCWLVQLYGIQMMRFTNMTGAGNQHITAVFRKCSKGLILARLPFPKTILQVIQFLSIFSCLSNDREAY